MSGRRAGLSWVAIAAVVAAIVAVVIIVVTNKQDHRTPGVASSSMTSPPATVAVGVDSLPPWPAPEDATAAARNAGLPMLSSEGMVEHIHAHLDVIADGRPVQ